MQGPPLCCGRLGRICALFTHQGLFCLQAVDGSGSRRVLADNNCNVLVFSQNGSRPLPNMLSGSDLVGGQGLSG